MKKLKLAHLSALTAAVMLAACGGSGDDPVSPEPPPPPPPAPTVACTTDTSVALVYEEQRLNTPLPFSGANVVGTDQTPLATRIVQAAGFQNFAPEFATALCTGGRTTITNYDQAVTAVRAQGASLWRAAVDRVQGRRAMAGTTLPQSDDRMLYWTRVQMTKVLRQWKPDFALTPTQSFNLQWEFERSSRGQYDLAMPTGNAPSGKKYRRMLVSGFDVFTLGTPGTANAGLRNGNPSGATALEMDGREITLTDGTVLHVEAYVLPVSYDPFNRGMQEDTIGPYYQPGPQRVDASITISQGGANQFWLEEFNGRFHGPTSGNDGIIYCPAGDTRYPSYILPLGTITAPGTDPISLPGSGCDINPPQRWLGYDATSAWMKDFPAQFSRSSLPMAALATGNSQAGIVRPAGVTSLGSQGFDVTWHTNFSVYPDCNAPGTPISIPATNLMNAMPDVSTIPQPDPKLCSGSGGGGTYLSNESAYRNTVLRDVFGLDVPAGHIHIPVMNNYHTPATTGLARDDNAITDSRYESYRTAIVGQTKALLTIVGNSLIYR